MKVSINLNEYVWVRLSEKGLRILRENHEDLRRTSPRLKEWMPPETDAEGRTKFAIWTLMQEFGQHIAMGVDLPFDITIHFNGEAR